MALPRVLILFNQPVLPANHVHRESELEILDTVSVVEQTLCSAGIDVVKLAVSHDPETIIQGVRNHRPDVVFNLFEGTGDDGSTESHAAGLLEWLRIPFTGCPAATLALARNKALAKHVLRSAKLPTADFLVLDSALVPEFSLNWPLIVKPATQDASVGVDHGSVVTHREQLQARVVDLLEKFGPPIIIEEFIFGREFNVTVVEAPQPKALPISEIVFLENKPGSWPIVTYDAKWRPGTSDYESTPFHAIAKIPPRLKMKLTKLALGAFALMGCRDYARVDFRVLASGRPYILEVNPNPDFNPAAGMAACLKEVAISHSQFTVQLVYNALGRASLADTFDPNPSVLGSVVC